MKTTPAIKALPLSHFLLSWGVGLAFATAIYAAAIGLIGIYVIKESLPKGKWWMFGLIIGGVVLPLFSAWRQASDLQHRDLTQRQERHAAGEQQHEIAGQLAAVKASLTTIDAQYKHATEALAKIASAANVSSAKSVNQIVSAIIGKLPKMPAPVGVRVVRLQPKPLTTGVVPSISMNLANGGPAKYVGLIYSVQIVHNVNGCFNNFQYRRQCEENLWLHFLSLPPIKADFMEVPSRQPISYELTAPDHMPVQAGETAKNTRYYFLARAYDHKGKRLFDSCAYVSPNAPANLTYCISHND